MKVLLTGNLGYIGPVVSKTLKQLLGPKTKVVGFDRGFFAGCNLQAASLPESAVDTQIYGDVRNDEDCLRALRGVDAVIHLAAISNDPMGNQFEKVTMDINYQRSVAMAKLAKQNGIKSFVFASSCSVYGAGGDDIKTEKSIVAPLTAYAKSKAMTEEGLALLADQDFKVTCLRFATACGPSPRLRLDLVLNDFVASAITTKKIEILSDGQPWRPLIAVKDMARVLTWAIQRGSGAGLSPFEVMNVGNNDWNFRVVQLAQAIQKIVDDIEISINTQAPPDKRSYCVSFDRLNSVIPAQFKPQEDLQTVIRQLAQQVEGCALIKADFRSGPFMRLNILRDLISKELINDNLFLTESPWI